MSESKIWFCADTHFNHANILKYCPGREKLGSTIEEMNVELIRRWNAVVADEDTVFFLGDFAFERKGLPCFDELLARLNGTLILIAGNHDKKRNDRFFSNVVRPGMVLELDGTLIELVHNPRAATGSGDIAFCGHVHQNWSTLTKGVVLPAYRVGGKKRPAFKAPCSIYNVGVDVRGFKPRSFREIVEPKLPSR